MGPQIDKMKTRRTKTSKAKHQQERRCNLSKGMVRGNVKIYLHIEGVPCKAVVDLAAVVSVLDVDLKVIDALARTVVVELNSSQHNGRTQQRPTDNPPFQDSHGTSTAILVHQWAEL
jgi:hypothetical protein